MAPSQEYGELLGHSIYFYSKDVGQPVTFTPPSFALQDITQIPRFRSFNAQEHGCRLWWIEYGGRLDTVHDTETIKWELWKVVYGVWNYIKNSGDFPEARDVDAGVGGAHSGQARKPALRGRLHADAAGHHRAAPASRRRSLTAVGRWICIRPTASSARSPAAISGTARASIRFPIAVCTAATSAICFWPGASSASRTWPLARRASRRRWPRRRRRWVWRPHTAQQTGCCPRSGGGRAHAGAAA